jgi:hypothetical protein
VVGGLLLVMLTFVFNSLVASCDVSGPDTAATASESPTLATDSARPSSKAPASFSKPMDREAVTSPFVAQGMAAVPNDKALWLMLRPPDGRYYFAQRKSLEISQNGDWAMPIRVGEGAEDVGLSYDLFLVMSPRTGSTFEDVIRRAESAQGGASQDSLPADSETVASVHITLANYH